MNKLESPKPNSQSQPAPGVPVFVQCDGYRCLATRDHDGTWHTYPGRRPIQKVLTVLPFNLPRSR